jgi:outer membrane protein
MVSICTPHITNTDTYLNKTTFKHQQWTAINMKKAPKLILSSIVMAFASHSFAASSDLISLYKNAENYDAEIFAAKAAFMAEKEGENIALAELLPSINASASAGRINSNKDSPSSDDSVKSQDYSVSLTQPLVNLQSWHKLSSSEQSTLQAQSIYLAAQQNLIIDVASAYFNVLRAQENLKSDQSQEAAVKRQYEQAREQFDVGLIAITDVHEAKASYDSSQTSRIRSEGDVTIATENLSRLTGQYTSELATLKSDFPITLDPSSSAEAWANSAYENNLNIKSAEYELEALNFQFKSRKSQHYPTLNFDARYGTTKLTNNDSGNNNSEEASASLNLNIPIYSGGGTQAGVRKVRYEVEKAKHLLTSAQRQARVEARTEYINIKTNIQTTESLQQNIVSRESALEATREGYKVGTRNIVEVLDAERNYYTALRDFANARFDFVESNLRIRRSAGTLNVKDLEVLNQWLEPIK